MSGLTMQGLRLDWRDPDLRRKAAVLVGAGVLHVLVLGWLALGVDRAPICDDCSNAPALFIEMEPRPLLPGETTRVRPPLDRPTPLTVRLAPPTATKPDRTETDRLDAPSPLTPHLAASPPAGSPPAAAAANPWAVRPDSPADGVARALRSSVIGCRQMFDRLSQVEQALCLDRLAEAAARARPIGPRTLTPSEQRRESQFAAEGAAALERYERRVAPLDGKVGIAGISPDCVGGNLRGTCAGANLGSDYQHPEDHPFGARSGPK